MDMDIIFKKAYDFLKKNDFCGIYKSIDIGELYIFFGGNPKETYYGIRTVSVEKNTGHIDWFDSNINRKKIKNGKEIDVPQEYKTKST